MKNVIIKLVNLEIANFKNVQNGKISFPNNNKELGSAEIIGVYGQNGSGKSALINSLYILKKVISGDELPPDVIHYIQKGSDTASFNFTFLYKYKNEEKQIFYEYALKIVENNVVISKEKVAFKNMLDTKHSKTTIIESSNDDDEVIFTPQIRFEQFAKGNKGLVTDLIVAKKLAYREQRSFIFNDETRKLLDRGLFDKDHLFLLEALVIFARINLFVIQIDRQGVINTDTLIPLAMHIDDMKGNTLTAGDLPLRFGINKYPDQALILFKKLAKQYSLLMNKIIPDLEIIYKEYGKETLKSGELVTNVELFSKRGETTIPIKYESDGIKKIISIISVLIAMYNRESVSVAIDELDSGVFEYLLGEILKVINDSGKGQLLFTSHNLHPLEVLDKESIYFTTTNPRNKFIKFANIKNNHNLRNMYFRIIEIGGQKECVYEETNGYDIARAFRLANKELAVDE